MEIYDDHVYDLMALPGDLSDTLTLCWASKPLTLTLTLTLTLIV